MQTDSSDNDYGSHTEEDFSDNEISPKAVASSMKTSLKRPLTAHKGKRKVSFDEREHDAKRHRILHSKDVSDVRKEKQHHSSTKTRNEKSEAKKPKKEEKEEILWNEANCDVDLDDHAASNVHYRKIKISNNLILSCKMISHLENKNLHSDYAALVFSRKTKGEKMFNFLVDMRVTERLIKALQIIIEENPVFFNKKPVAALTQKH